MANVISGSPLIIDTAAATVIISTQFRVQALQWDPGTSAANLDVLTVKDKLGVVKFSQTLLTGNLVPAPITFPRPIIFNGLIVSAMTHGTLYVYLADNNNVSA